MRIETRETSAACLQLSMSGLNAKDRRKLRLITHLPNHCTQHYNLLSTHVNLFGLDPIRATETPRHRNIWKQETKCRQQCDRVRECDVWMI